MEFIGSELVEKDYKVNTKDIRILKIIKILIFFIFLEISLDSLWTARYFIKYYNRG